MEEKPNYYAIIPAEVRYDKDLKDKAKLLYGEITSLSDKTGYCYASNKYFAELYEVSIETISRLITDLINKGYITRTILYKDNTKEIVGRYLQISQYLLTKKSIPIDQKVNKNNTSNNNTSINKKEYKERFKKPTLEEVKAYCIERQNGISAENFINFYESKDWYIGKSKMKNWKACIRTWETRNKKQDLPTWFEKDIKEESIDDTEEKELKEWLQNYE